VTPTAGAKEGTSAAATKRGCHSFLGEPCPKGRGEPKSVIDSKRRRLKCLAPSVLLGHGKEAHHDETAKKHGGAFTGQVTQRAGCGVLGVELNRPWRYFVARRSMRRASIVERQFGSTTVTTLAASTSMMVLVSTHSSSGGRGRIGCM